VIPKPPLATGRHKYEIALCSSNSDLERNRMFSFPFFPPKQFSLSPVWSLFGGQHIDHHARNKNYHLTSGINLAKATVRAGSEMGREVPEYFM